MGNDHVLTGLAVYRVESYPDDDAYLDQSGASNNLGEIMIEIWRVAPIASTAASRMHFPEAQKVHERSKKALAHRVK